MSSDLKRRAARILKALRKQYPDAHCELDFTTPLELAIGCILSAQCTDKRVNQVTPALFKKYTTAQDWASADPSELEREIHSTGFFRNKTRNIIALGQALVEQFEGAIPNDFDALVKLPGIGRKTANVIMVSAFDQPGIVVDTHMKRLANRMGFTKQQHPDKIEFDLQRVIPRAAWGEFSHVMVFHGRRCCHARNPDCAQCVIAQDCPSCQIKQGSKLDLSD